MQQKKYISRKNEKGFTLVEVMVAVAILSFGILAVAAMQNAALLGTTKARAVTEATTVAMDRMERIFAIPYAALETYPLDTARDDSDLSGAPPLTPDITSVEWDLNVSSLPGSIQANARRVRVTVQTSKMTTPIVLENIIIKMQ